MISLADVARGIDVDVMQQIIVKIVNNAKTSWL